MKNSFLFSHIKKNYIFFLLALFGVLLSGSVSIAIGKVIGFSVSHLSTSKSLTNLFLIITGSILFLSISVFFRVSMIGLTGARIVQGVQKDLYKRFTGAKIAAINQCSGNVASAFTVDIAILQNFLSSGFSILLRNSFTLVGSVIMLLLTDAVLFLYALLIISIVLGIIISFGKKVRKLSIESRNSIDILSNQVNDDINNIKIIKAFTCEDSFTEKFFHNIKDAYSIFTKCSVMRATLVGIIIASAFLGISSVGLIGISKVSAGKITAAKLSEFIFYSLLAASSTNSLVEIYNEIHQVQNVNKRFQDLYNALGDQDRRSENEPQIKNFQEIEFKNVSFKYNNYDHYNLVCDHLNFVIKKGEVVAIVGPSGAGKSTIFNLLLDFYDIDSGEILINNENIKNFSTKQIRGLFAWVPQDANLISGTIAENITMKGSNTCKKDLEDACKNAHVTEFMEKLPQKENTIVASKAEKELSRGQQQRIAIARAIFADTPIIIFDEATSSLDAKSEAFVQDSIKNLRGKKTIIIIAHRFSAIRDAEKIIVVRDGKINDIGAHEDLMLTNEYYRTTINLQMEREKFI